MAKGRMINRRISKSDKLAALAKDRYRVIYFMIYPHLDREGRFSADPRDIKEDCCPRLRYSVKDISESLSALHKVGLINLYKVNEKQYLEASRFDDFQVGLHKDREAPSEIPPNSGLNPESSGNCRTGAEKVPLNLNVNLNLNKILKVKVNKEENPPPKEWIDQATVEIPKIFKKFSVEHLLEDKTFFDYLIMLSWEFKELDTCDEIGGKLTHWIKNPPTEKSNICLQFRNWFRIARKIEQKRKKEKEVGKRSNHVD